MRLYLVQHGKATPKEVDAQRPLTDRGRRDVERIATFLGNAGIHVGTVLHSGKKRAEQTAKLLAATLGAGLRLDKVSGIDPLDSAARFAKVVSDWTEDTMVVGHLPFMGRLISHLVVGGEETLTATFQTGAVVCLEHTDEGKWSIAWMIRPELLPDRIPDQP